MARSARFWIVLLPLLAGASLVYLAGNNTVALWDRDEPLYAESSREMLQSGDWVVPKFLGEWRLEKPPLIYWCQAASMELLGTTDGAVRLPSTLAVVLTALTIGLVVRHCVGDRRALWTVFIFCTCGLVIAASKFCITDAVLSLFVIGGQACLAVMYAAAWRGKNAPFWVAVTFWITVGLAGLTKGPQVLGMHAMTLLILLLLDVGPRMGDAAAWWAAMRWWRQMRPLIGVPILALVVAPWLVAIHRRAPGFVSELIHKARLHASTSMDGHGEPPGYHLLLLFGTFFPWSLFLPITISQMWCNRRLPAIRFAAAMAAGPWLLMELVWTKLPFYVMPAFAGLSFLTADVLVRCLRGRCDELRQRGFAAMAAVWAVAGLGLGAAPWCMLLITRQVPRPGMIALSVAAALYVGIVCLRFWQGRIFRAAVAMGVGASMLIAILYTAILPNLQFATLSRRLAADLPPEARGPSVPVTVIGYSEPSLIYYQGGGAKREPLSYLEKTPASQWPRWFMIDQSEWRSIPAALRGLLQPIAVEQGIVYSANGRSQTILLLQKAD